MDGESRPQLQHLQPQTPKDGAWDASSCLPRAGVPTDLVEASGLLQPLCEDVVQGDIFIRLLRGGGVGVSATGQSVPGVLAECSPLLPTFLMEGEQEL